MTHTYNITGMTCGGCVAKVKKLLLSVSGVAAVNINLEKQNADISMGQHIATQALQKVLEGTHYAIKEAEHAPATAKNIPIDAETPITLKTYLPLILVFGYITGVTLLVQAVSGHFNATEWMRHFMAGFFLVFSFFKMLDIQGFAISYSSYDVIAKRWPGYGYIYPFIELALGISFLIPSLHFYSNLATLIIMSISIVGVLQSVLNKRKIQCACLGAVFNLPMSTVTIIEDGLMMVMSLVGLIIL